MYIVEPISNHLLWLVSLVQKKKSTCNRIRDKQMKKSTLWNTKMKFNTEKNFNEVYVKPAY